AESIEDHGKLLATSGYYTHAMARRHDPNAFAAALTGIYATDPQYGAKLVSLMQQYDLYRYDSAAPAPVSHTAAPSAAAIPRLPPRRPPALPALPRSSPAGPGAGGTPGPAADPAPAAAPVPPAAASPAPERRKTPSPAPSSPSPARSPRPSSPAPARSPIPSP